MRLRATVRHATGNTRHLIHGAEHVDVVAKIASVAIERGDGGWFLFYLDADGTCIADTWHETQDLAKRQATFEFGIDADDWLDVS